MGVFSGPNLSEDGLVLALDAANQKGISPLGNEAFNSASQLLKNLVSTSDTITSPNGVKLGNLSYYTVFAIDYPESSYGGDGASRHGITPGFNVRSGNKLFSFGRALNYAVYNNPTQSWVKLATYDSYVGSGPVDTFVSEYATAVATYPDAIHVVSGSHRDSYHTTAQYAILRDLGAPSNVDSIIGFSSPEWILVGKPGLGAGNAYGWVFQNYETNPDQVAHLNFGLPIYGNVGNYLEFDGSNDYVTCGTFSVSFLTVSTWVYRTSSATEQGICRKQNGWAVSVYQGALQVAPGTSWQFYNTGYTIPLNTWVNIVYTYSGTGAAGSQTVYINGSSIYSTSAGSGAISSNANVVRVGFDDNGWFWNGRIAQTQIYNRALSAAEIQQNFNALRGRFGI